MYEHLFLLPIIITKSHFPRQHAPFMMNMINLHLIVYKYGFSYTVARKDKMER